MLRSFYICLQIQPMLSLLSAIEEKVAVSEELKEALLASFERRKVGKGELLLQEGHQCRHLYFLESGTVRSFYQEAGTEVTHWFFREHSFFSSWYGLYTGEPGYESIEMVGEGVVYAIHYEDYEKLMDEYRMFERFARILAQETVALVDSFSKGYMLLSAREKYELILRYIPDIEQRVKLGQLASFLGISQETLSRVRAQK